jgi:hypothetical protein
MILSNPAAAGAGQIAPMSRLQHQYKRKPIDAMKFFPNKIAGHGKIKTDGKTHLILSFLKLESMSKKLK